MIYINFSVRSFCGLVGDYIFLTLTTWVDWILKTMLAPLSLSNQWLQRGDLVTLHVGIVLGEPGVFFLNGNIIYTCRFFMVFPECVARVPVSLWGSGGWGCVRSTLRSRAQPFATVRNRSRDPRMAVPMGSSAEVVIFGGFRRVVASFRVAGAILLRRFQRMCCSFRGRRSTLGVSIVIFRGRRSTLDVSRCVFFANRIGRAASSGDKVQIPWQAWHFVRCAENWRKPRTKHRFWCCQFSGSKENS